MAITLPLPFSILGPLARLLPAETAHRWTIAALKRGYGPVQTTPDDAILATEVWGRRFANPIGLAAGFDKDAEVMDAALALGFGLTEVGTVTPLPQPGNPKPRVFRLPADRAVINRYGFNSQGAAAVAAHMMARFEAKRAGSASIRPGLVGINIGRNKTSQDALEDYARGAARFARLCDYLVVNVSSPNTPGLRALQSRDELSALVRAVRAALDGAIAVDDRVGSPAPALLVKIAPDLAESDLVDIAEIAMNGGMIDGLIVSNTTIERPESLKSARRSEAGGLSGRPLFARSTELLRNLRTLTHGQVPMVGVGGVSSGRDAYAKIRAGASLVQLYTALVYEGPGLVGRIKADLAAMLRADGFASVADAVGVDS